MTCLKKVRGKKMYIPNIHKIPPFIYSVGRKIAIVKEIMGCVRKAQES